MGASGSKARAFGPSLRRQEAASRRLRELSKPCSMFYDENGELAHEFYEETIVAKNGQKPAKLRRLYKNLTPQGIVKLDPPHTHIQVDFPVILYEV
ncbi:Tumor suppressor candidate 2 [Heterocephalus glaber]|uniref:Tumor suppressor candidate 2 n=1 Tax=Heterocephalus glaber TaxID=10181 RepID=G5AVA1_HETGA|nr:Tumor suppressor candidate 2 [Heterocephalus glaber]